MLDNIAPGTQVNVKIVKAPTNAAAKKTLVRILSKDRTVKAEDARQRKIRKGQLRQSRRGGRFWDVNPIKQPSIHAETGLTGTVTATTDVLTDLKSVSRFVEVTKA